MPKWQGSKKSDSRSQKQSDIPGSKRALPGFVDTDEAICCSSRVTTSPPAPTANRRLTLHLSSLPDLGGETSLDSRNTTS